ncbi:MAG: MBL fold metallo-hydrolase [Chloroflexota bacterium]
MQLARPDEWYRTQNMGDGVTYIYEQYMPPFFRCNMFHVRGSERDMLVDSGSGVVPLRDWVAILNGRPLVAVASHTHFDHIGCQFQFEERLVHVAEADIMANPTRENTLIEDYVTAAEDLFTKLPPNGFDPATYSIPAAPATATLQDGDLIDLGDRTFAVIHTPGHSPGGIALWEEATGVLIAGDIVYDGELVEDTYHSDMDDYIASMKRLLDIPAKIVHGGHFDSFDGDRMREIITEWLREKGAL